MPLADVQHIEKRPNNSIPGIMVITRNTRWDFDRDDWSSRVWFSEPEAARVLGGVVSVSLGTRSRYAR